MRIHVLACVGVAAACLTVSIRAQVAKENVDGIRNLARLETTVACAGSVTPEAVPEIKKFGFVSIINLREANEPGAEVEKEGEAAKAVGLKYFHVPFNTASPTNAAADQFLAAITSPGAEPSFIHCASGNRAAAMWLIKRMTVDHWEADRATAEAAALGLTNAALKQWALDYVQTHKK
jgi:uncharacterized protein (TIGR01244 family)